MSILLYIYICLIAYRYTASDITVNQNITYFTLNYIIASIGILGTIFNTLTLINEK